VVRVALGAGVQFLVPGLLVPEFLVPGLLDCFEFLVVEWLVVVVGLEDAVGLDDGAGAGLGAVPGPTP